MILSVWRRRGAKVGGIVNRDQAERMFGPAFAGVLPDGLLRQRAFDAAFPEFERDMLNTFLRVEKAELLRAFPGAVLDVEEETLDLSFPSEAITDKNSLRMLYRVWRCNELKRALERRQGHRFDLVVRFRPDVVPELTRELVGTMLTDDPERTIYVPHALGDDISLDDVAAASSSAVADRYATLFGKAILSPGRDWKLIHYELADHVRAAGLRTRRLPLRSWIVEDYAARQPANRALLLRHLAEARFNRSRPHGWGPLHTLARAADLLEQGAPLDAVLEGVPGIDLAHEDLDTLRRAARLVAAAAERHGRAALLYAAQLCVLACAAETARAAAPDPTLDRGDLGELNRAVTALGLDGVPADETLDPARFDDAVARHLAAALRHRVPDPSWHLAKIRAQAGLSPEAVVRMFARLRAEGRSEEARAVAENLVARHPNDWIAHDMLGHALSAAGEPEQALACARRALELESNHGGLAARVGTLLMLLGRWSEALPHLGDATRLWSDPQPWLWYAQGLRGAGRPEEAERALRDAVHRFGPDPELLQALGTTAP